MASGLYAKAKQSFLANEIKWVTGTTDTFLVYLVDTNDYLVDLTNHEFATVFSGTGVVATGTIANPTASGGVADGDNVTLSSVTGDVSEALVIVKSTGNLATTRLIAYIDTVVSGLPVTPNGGDITITWDNGANKIFKL
jgi:hypothetical protein